MPAQWQQDGISWCPVPAAELQALPAWLVQLRDTGRLLPGSPSLCQARGSTGTARERSGPFPCQLTAAQPPCCTHQHSPRGSAGALQDQVTALGTSRLNAALACGTAGVSHVQLRSLHLPCFGASSLLGRRPKGNEKPEEGEQPAPQSGQQSSGILLLLPAAKTSLKAAVAHTGE